MNTATNLIANLQQQIKTRMEEKNLTAREVERKAGLKISAVRNIMIGKSNNPGIETLVAVSKTLGCSMDELIGGAGSITLQPKHELDKSKASHIWNPALYQDCLQQIEHYLNTLNFKPTAEHILFFAKETYLYSLEGQEAKADLRFMKWIIESNC